MKLLTFSVLLAGLVLGGPSVQAQAPTASTPSAVERDLRVFSSWVDSTVTRVEANVRRELPRLMGEFDRQSKRIDRAADSLSTQAKREYNAEKARYKDWEARQRQADQEARKSPAAGNPQDRLLNEKVNIAQARATELPDLYERLLATTRDQRRQWSPADWSQASAVLTRLNARYEQVRTQLSLDDRLRIRTLQGEFRTLESARSTKDYLNDRQK